MRTFVLLSFGILTGILGSFASQTNLGGWAWLVVLLIDFLLFAYTDIALREQSEDISHLVTVAARGKVDE